MVPRYSSSLLITLSPWTVYAQLLNRCGIMWVASDGIVDDAFRPAGVLAAEYIAGHVQLWRSSLTKYIVFDKRFFLADCCDTRQPN